MTVQKIMTRFGEVEYDSENTIHFPEGLVGLEDLHDFIVMPNKKKGPLFWIQCVNNPEFAFVVTDPTSFFLDYTVPQPGDDILEKLRIKKDGKFFVLSIVSVHSDQEVTLNLAAPLYFAPESNRAVQVILENSPYGVRTPLPKVKAG